MSEHPHAAALRAFAARARQLQCDRLRQVVLYGSQARGDAQPDSDIDVAVVVDAPSGADYLDVAFGLADAAYDVLLETGVDIQPVPIWAEHWDHPERHSNPRFVANVRRDAIQVLP